MSVACLPVLFRILAVLCRYVFVVCHLCCAVCWLYYAVVCLLHVVLSRKLAAPCHCISVEPTVLPFMSAVLFRMQAVVCHGVPASSMLACCATVGLLHVACATVYAGCIMPLCVCIMFVGAIPYAGCTSGWHHLFVVFLLFRTVLRDSNFSDPLTSRHFSGLLPLIVWKERAPAKTRKACLS